MKDISEGQNVDYGLKFNFQKTSAIDNAAVQINLIKNSVIIIILADNRLNLLLTEPLLQVIYILYFSYHSIHSNLDRSCCIFTHKSSKMLLKKLN